MKNLLVTLLVASPLLTGCGGGGSAGGGGGGSGGDYASSYAPIMVGAMMPMQNNPNDQ